MPPQQGGPRRFGESNTHERRTKPQTTIPHLQPQRMHPSTGQRTLVSSTRRRRNQEIPRTNTRHAHSRAAQRTIWHYMAPTAPRSTRNNRIHLQPLWTTPRRTETTPTRPPQTTRRPRTTMPTMPPPSVNRRNTRPHTMKYGHTRTTRHVFSTRFCIYPTQKPKF